jgi:hypothetical protein
MLMAVIESDGLARKKSEIGTERPCVGPFCQVAPDEFLRSAGTKTRHLPCASTYRNGRSLLCGVAVRVV